MLASGSEAPSVSKTPASKRGLLRLRNGEITIAEYLDVRADVAIGHLTQFLTAAELQSVRNTIREQLTTDPVVLELVRRATGQDVGDVGNR